MTLGSVFTLSLITLSLSACSQSVGKSGSVTPEANPIQNGGDQSNPGDGRSGNPSDPGTPGDPASTPVPTAFGETIGNRSFAVVVNKAMAVIGEENGNKFAQLRTQSGISSPGAYYNVGYGNKAFLGFGINYNLVPVSEFESLSFRTFEPTTNRSIAYNVYINLLVDLNCNPLKPKYTVVLTRNLRGNPKGQWNTYHFTKTDAVFRTPGGLGGMPDSNEGDAPAALTRLVQNHPTACFVANDIFGVGMKRNQKLAPFQLVHGDSIYTTASAVRIDDIELHMANSTLLEDFE
jgi:hypothetical protein